MLHPITEQEFNTLALQGYNRIPLVSETFADLDTPLSLYLKLANKPYSYLLESVQGGERFGRYSFIGLPADTRITVAELPGLPRFCGGLAGYFGYDTIRYIEPRLAPENNKNISSKPDSI